MITDYYGDGNRYRGVTSTGGKTRTIVIAGNAVLHDTASDLEQTTNERNLRSWTRRNKRQNKRQKGSAT